MTKNGTKNRVFELLLMAFLGKFCNNFCKIVRHEKDQEVDDNNINNFFQKNSCLEQIDHFGPKNGASS